jgi:hypothetical protein
VVERDEEGLDGREETGNEWVFRRCDGMVVKEGEREEEERLTGGKI